MTLKELEQDWKPSPEIAAMIVAERAAWIDKIWATHGVRVTPNDQAQAQPPETSVACNDDVQISWLGQN